MLQPRRQGKIDQIKDWFLEQCNVERWKIKFINIEFPWLWAIRNWWHYDENSRLVLKAENLEGEKIFKRLAEFGFFPSEDAEIWVHEIFASSESVYRVDLNGVDRKRPDELARAIISHRNLRTIINVAFVERNRDCDIIIVFRSKGRPGFEGVLSRIAN